MARKNEHAHLSAVARYCCRADEVETSAVFNIRRQRNEVSRGLRRLCCTRGLTSFSRTMHTCMVCRVSTIKADAGLA